MLSNYNLAPNLRPKPPIIQRMHHLRRQSLVLVDLWFVALRGDSGLGG